MNEDRLRAAVAAGVMSSEQDYRALLHSIVEVARAIFAARASSITLLDEEADELVFEAVAGEGSETLVGRRMPSGTGIMGWTLTTRQPLVIEDVSADPRHSREAAQETGYVPEGLMSVPLLHEERALGVLQVLDRQTPFTLQEMELLGLFANEAAVALDLLQRGRRASQVLEGSGEDVALVARLAARLDALEGEKRAAALELLRALEEILT
jgi:GAF domain-containing protein